MAHNCQKLRFLFLSHLPSACLLLSRLSQHVGRLLKLQSLWPKLFPERGKKWSQGMGWYFQLLSAFLIIFLKVLHETSIYMSWQKLSLMTIPCCKGGWGIWKFGTKEIASRSLLLKNMSLLYYCHGGIGDTLLGLVIPISRSCSQHSST